MHCSLHKRTLRLLASTATTYASVWESASYYVTTQPLGMSVISMANQWLAEDDPVSGVHRTILTSCAVAVDLCFRRVVCVPTTCPHEVL